MAFRWIKCLYFFEVRNKKEMLQISFNKNKELVFLLGKTGSEFISSCSKKIFIPCEQTYLEDINDSEQEAQFQKINNLK